MHATSYSPLLTHPHKTPNALVVQLFLVLANVVLRTNRTPTYGVDREVALNSMKDADKIVALRAGGESIEVFERAVAIR